MTSFSEMFFLFVLIACFRVVNNTLKSPGYPNDYPNNLHCVHKVPIPHKMALKFVFQYFDVEFHYHCR